MTRQHHALFVNHGKTVGIAIRRYAKIILSFFHAPREFLEVLFIGFGRTAVKSGIHFIIHEIQFYPSIFEYLLKISIACSVH